MENAKVQIIQVPYDSGNRSVRMGSGPEHLIKNGLDRYLQEKHREVSIESIETKNDFRAEIETQFELYRLLSGRIARARRDGRFPLILSGNCGATLGAIAGNEIKPLGVIWFDAHGDFNTPETSHSGFLDGMGLAIAAGLCWKPLASTIPNFQSLNGADILHVGGRDFDSQEKIMFEQVGATVVDTATIRQTSLRAALEPAILKLAIRVKEAHLHIDLDVLNPKEAPANEYVTEEGGLSIGEVVEAIKLIKLNLKLTSATIAAFDPRCDPHGKTVEAAFSLINEIIG